MASLYRRKNGYWQVLALLGGKRVEVSTRQKGRTPNEVARGILEKYRMMEGCERHGIPYVDRDVTISQLYQKYNESKPFIGERTASYKKKLIDRLIATVGDKKVACFTIRDADEFMANGWKRPIHPNTKAVYKFQIASIWNWGVKRKLVHENPWSQLDLKQSQKSPRRPLTDDEIKLILANAQGCVLLSFALGLYQGARISDCANLRGEDINWEKRTIQFTERKGSRKGIPRIHVMPMHPFVQSILQELPRKGRYMNVCAGHLVHKFRRFFDKLGLYDISHHYCRHTFITKRIEVGVSQAQVAELAGHTSWAMTRRYTHQSVDSLRGALEAGS